MTKTVLFCAVAALLALGFGWKRQGDLLQLRQDNERLRLQLEELIRLAGEAASFEAIDLDLQELERLRPVRRELARLRSELTLLQEAARSRPDELQQQIESASSEAAREQREFELLQAREENRLITRDARNEASGLLDVLRDMARVNNGALPHAFPGLEEGLLRLLSDETSAFQHHFHRNWERFFAEEHHRLGRLTHFFEFIPRSHPVLLNGSPVPVLRERTPRALPDGGWVRVYGFSDGRSEEVVLPDGAYAEWERQMAAR